MPSEITTPGAASAIDRLALGTEAVRGANANFPVPFCSCNCAEFDATPSIPGACCAPCMCAVTE